MDQPSNLPGFLHPESHQAPVNGFLAASATTRVKACTSVRVTPVGLLNLGEQMSI